MSHLRSELLTQDQAYITQVQQKIHTLFEYSAKIQVTTTDNKISIEFFSKLPASPLREKLAQRKYFEAVNKTLEELFKETKLDKAYFKFLEDNSRPEKTEESNDLKILRTKFKIQLMLLKILNEVNYIDKNDLQSKQTIIFKMMLTLFELQNNFNTFLNIHQNPELSQLYKGLKNAENDYLSLKHKKFTFEFSPHFNGLEMSQAAFETIKIFAKDYPNEFLTLITMTKSEVPAQNEQKSPFSPSSMLSPSSIFSSQPFSPLKSILPGQTRIRKWPVLQSLVKQSSRGTLITWGADQVREFSEKENDCKDTQIKTKNEAKEIIYDQLFDRNSPWGSIEIVFGSSCLKAAEDMVKMFSENLTEAEKKFIEKYIETVIEIGCEFVRQGIIKNNIRDYMTEDLAREIWNIVISHKTINTKATVSHLLKSSNILSESKTKELQHSASQRQNKTKPMLEGIITYPRKKSQDPDKKEDELQLNTKTVKLPKIGNGIPKSKNNS